MSAPTRVTLAEQYLVHRRILGFKLRSEGELLLNFARFADAMAPECPITVDLAVRWAAQPGTRTRLSSARRLDAARAFARYCATFEHETEIPPRGLLGASRRRTLLHVYTQPQIEALVAAAQVLRPAKGLRPKTYSTLFGLLAASGLRVSEALRLARADSDLASGVLTIRMTKFRKSRLVPLHPTTRAALRVYALERDRLVPRPATAAFFLSSRGEPLPYRTVHSVFDRLRADLGWNVLTPRPRIHDLRHAFACRRIEQWYEQGADVASRVPSLATYLGHAHATDTYWYLTATPTLLARAASRFEAYGVSPEVQR